MNDINYLSKHWAITPDALHTLCASLKERQAGLSLFSERPLDNTRTVRIRDGVAIIPIQGVITPRLDFFTLLFGGTALDVLAKDFQNALENKDVKAILLDIDSPGGVAVGPAEMSEIIYNARKQKPIYSYVGRNCCSAAYWLASATEKIIAHKSALLGSIGVVSTLAIQEKADANGYKNFEIVSSNAKNKRPDPRTPEGISEIRRELDSLENEFINSIAKYRNLKVETILKDFGQGGVMIGSQAAEVGMADMLGTYESVLATLSADNSNQNKGEKQMSDKEKMIDKDNITADFLKRERLDIVEALREEGAKAERERLNAIDNAALAGYDELVAAAKADPKMTAEKLALQIIGAEKAKGTSYIDALKTAEEKMPKITHGANAGEDKPKISPIAPATERAEAEWNANVELRTEFNGDKEAFVAYYLANDNGQVKLHTKKGK